MGKKRKSLASSLDEVDRTMYSTFCSAANSLSQLYTQAMNQQKLSFLSGERHGMDSYWEVEQGFSFGERCMSGPQEIFCDGDRKEAGKKYGIPKAPEEELYFDCLEKSPFKVVQWFELGTSMLEVSSSKPLASESKGFAFLGRAHHTGLA
ncbi:hypothetical protein MTR67_050638 [Solanum verrucosum]|uniref:Uncharacterized protein n=1 Tax=Solanum verrucosum TaxID=315347 RepID=A0AAF0V5T4_SOLVR|nr:hypothetical protein MTR67_050638 [Solanum verrucosum]